MNRLQRLNTKQAFFFLPIWFLIFKDCLLAGVVLCDATVVVCFPVVSSFPIQHFCVTKINSFHLAFLRHFRFLISTKSYAMNKERSKSRSKRLPLTLIVAVNFRKGDNTRIRKFFLYQISSFFENRCQHATESTPVSVEIDKHNLMAIWKTKKFQRWTLQT